MSIHTLIKLGLFFLLLVSSQANALELKFGVYTSDIPSAMVKQFRPILNQLEIEMAKQLNEPVKIKLEVSADYQIGLEALVKGQVDFSRFGPASYIAAKKQDPSIDILAVENNKGSKQFYGVICVREPSNIVSVKDLKGKRFAFGNQQSTIGRYLSQQYLMNNGITAKDLSEYNYLDRHDKVGSAVANGLMDAGALKENTFNKLVKKGAKLRILAKFANVTKPWIASSQMSEQVKQALTKSLLSLSPEHTASIKKQGFLPGNDDDYAIIRSAIENNAQFFEQ